MMILSNSERTMVLTLCRNAYSERSLKHRCIKQYKGCTEIKLGDTGLSLEVTKNNCDNYKWLLYVNGTEIDIDSDGSWWDIVRNEVPKIRGEVCAAFSKNYNDQRDEQRMHRISADQRRANKLQRAEDYINGWRWWKLWWRRG